MIRKLGYACINMDLSDKPKGKRITTNRTCRKATWQNSDEPLVVLGELAYKNTRDLIKIINWNEQNDIKFFRVSSDLLPWWSYYRGIYNLPKPYSDGIAQNLKAAGKLARKFDQRLTTHPGPFNKLASLKKNVLRNTIDDLEMHAHIFDCMGYDPSVENKINIHVGATYGDKERTAEVFCRHFQQLSLPLQKRLTVENDDRASLFSTKDLYDMLHKNIGIPIVHDLHHHNFCDGGQTQEEALELAVSSWPEGITPVVHYSESRSIEYNDPKIKAHAHSDYIKNKINTYDYEVDVMIEAKAKERALLKYAAIHGVN